MKSLNFNSLYKTAVVVLLLIIAIFLTLQFFSKSEIGRYKEVRIPKHSRGEQIGEDVKILDTKTGNYVN